MCVQCYFIVGKPFISFFHFLAHLVASNYIVNFNCIIKYGIPGTKAPESFVSCLNRNRVSLVLLALICLGGEQNQVTNSNQERTVGGNERKVLPLIIQAVWQSYLLPRKPERYWRDDHDVCTSVKLFYHKKVCLEYFLLIFYVVGSII